MKRYRLPGKKLRLETQTVATLASDQLRDAKGAVVTDPTDGTGASCDCPSLITCYLYCLTASDAWTCQ